jgi:crossover junction endodeoxyribonuclease RuvC
MAVGFVLISTAPVKEHKVYERLKKVPEIVELHPLFGEFDLIAKIETKDYNELGKIVVEKIRMIDGVIDTKKDSFNERLKVIFESLSEIIKEHQPNQMAIESVFVHKNANSALKLGHARAAAICASFESDINVFEYSPREVKLSTVGTGKAEKEQVMEMVKLILSIKQSTLKLDESDALAVGICHAHSQSLKDKIEAATK